MNDDARMQAFVQKVAAGLIDPGEPVEVAVIDGRRATRFEIDVPAASRGKIIGKEGATIRALRTLVEISAHKHRRRFEVEIPD